MPWFFAITAGAPWVNTKGEEGHYPVVLLSGQWTALGLECHHPSQVRLFQVLFLISYLFPPKLPFRVWPSD